MQRQLCRGSIRNVLEKWPQKWQVMLAFNAFCITVKGTQWKGTRFLQGDWLWGNSLTDADQAITLTIRSKFPVYKKSKDTLHCAGSLGIYCMNMQLGKNYCFQDNIRTPHTSWNVRAGVCVCTVAGLHRLLLGQVQSLGCAQLQCRLCYVKGISRIQGNFRPKWLLLVY